MPEGSSVIITPTEEDVDRVRGYRVGMWRTFKNYCCIYCQYATIWPEKMKKHQAENNHPWAFPGGDRVESEAAREEPQY